MIDAISFKEGTFRYLDQRFLPLQELHVETRDHREAIEAIKTLAVRGAPLIGASAGYTIVLGVNNFSGRKEDFPAYFRQLIADVEASRPTAVNLFFASKKMKAVYDANFESNSLEVLKTKMTDEAHKIYTDEVENCDRIARHGVEQIKRDCAEILKNAETECADPLQHRHPCLLRHRHGARRHQAGVEGRAH